jgi:hypothetical protein
MASSNARRGSPAWRACDPTRALHTERHRRLPDGPRHAQRADGVRGECHPRAEPPRMLMDVAHATEPLVRAAVKVATKPLLLSHTALQGSKAQGNTPLAGRQISADHARMIADTDGVVACSTFPRVSSVTLTASRRWLTWSEWTMSASGQQKIHLYAFLAASGEPTPSARGDNRHNVGFAVCHQRPFCMRPANSS